MAYKTDIEIAQETKLIPINEIAASLGIPDEAVENYGRYKAKIDIGALKGLPEKAKLIVVTAITPTPAGEGKTTTSVGLADGLRKIGKKTVVALR
jgi:formate--tetrahydrofolate ligase